MAMRPKHIKKPTEFPNLSKKNHLVTSDDNSWHNCIAFAYGDKTLRYWPNLPDYYWPSDLPKSATVETFKMLFSKKGYGPCQDGTYIEGYEKIAIFADPQGAPKHASLQIGSGKWASKLGLWYDIEHTEHAVSGGSYGKIVAYMQRKKI
jgi:hypothetical protein